MSQTQYEPGSIASLISGSEADTKKTDKKLEKLFTSPKVKKNKKKEKKENEASETETLKRERKASENENDTEQPSKKKKKKKKNANKENSKVKNVKPEEKLYTGETRKEAKLKKREIKTKEARTVFVGNLPNSVTKKTLLKLFKHCGKIESTRVRSAAPADLKLPKKAVVIKKEFHPERHNLNAYVVFDDKESLKEALKVNGKSVEGFHIRVDIAGRKNYDTQQTIFVGNLPFDIEEESVRNHFEDCGEIENIRIIRDKKTGLGKGFGYINFKDKDAATFALKLHEQKFKGRPLRVQRASNEATLNEEKRKKKKALKSGKGGIKENETGKKNTPKKMMKPSNMSAETFKGVKASKLEKIKKKKKRIKKIKSTGSSQEASVKGGKNKKDIVKGSGLGGKQKDSKKPKDKIGNKVVGARNRVAKKMKKGKLNFKSKK